jgi:hypothetical protein
VDRDNQVQVVRLKAEDVVAAVMLIQVVRQLEDKQHKVLNQDKAVLMDLDIQVPVMDKAFQQVGKSAVVVAQEARVDIIPVVQAVLTVSQVVLYSVEAVVVVVLEITVDNLEVAEAVVTHGH